MDTNKIGVFLKTLRKEKGLTQEQLAETLLVSGRSVSRWETGTNMPDLSILIQLAEFYDVEIKEILDGERMGEPMDPEWKETLCKVADYHKLEKERAARIGHIAFAITFAACAAAIVLQLLRGGSLAAVSGETVTLFAGGVAYLGMMLYNGLGNSTWSVQDTLIGLLCSGGSAIVFYFRSVHLGAAPTRAAHGAILFFLLITILGFALMRIFSSVSRIRKNKT